MSERGAGADLTRAEWQTELFSECPRLWELLKLQAGWPLKTIILRVHRNHAFELVATMMASYAAFGGWAAQFIYSDYSDALDFSKMSRAADAELIWLDRLRYEGLDDLEMVRWLSLRLSQLRGVSTAPIIVMLSFASSSMELDLQRAVDGIAACYIAGMSETAQKLGDDFFDTRLESLGGTKLSRSALTDVAREIACKWVPGAVFPPIKAVALDLDNTLYSGVLGEDGREGIDLTPGHKELQGYLHGLPKRGVFLALVSRNQRRDVEELFTVREDFPISWTDFSATRIGWTDKADSLLEISRQLRISFDAILYVDDNPGELASVAMRLPGLQTLHARPDPFETLRGLEYYPGLWRWRYGKDDRLRTHDLKASQARSALLAETVSEEDYFSLLNVHLQLALDPMSRLARLSELSRKTNQFNVALGRIPEAQMARYMSSCDSAVVGAYLKDRLSDSGLIFMMVVKRLGKDLAIEELCISCRALGRQLEAVMIGQALALAQRKLKGRRVYCRWRKGPRNQPALEWLEKASGQPLESSEGLCALKFLGPPVRPPGVTVSLLEGGYDAK